VTRQLRWTEHAVTQLGSIAEYISLASPVYAEQIVERIVGRLAQAVEYPESGRVVPELAQPSVRELIEMPYRLIYRVDAARITVLSILHGRQELRELV
jgi:plasmid stabilization system protein ParE